MVVRSVVRRSRLKELGVGRATFGAAGELGPVGATVDIPSDKKIKVAVTIENTGSQSVTGDFTVEIFYADTLSDSTGYPASDRTMWRFESEASDSGTVSDATLDVGGTLTIEGASPVDISEVEEWSEGMTIDAGIVLIADIDTTRHVLDSLKIADAVKIIAPALRVEITDVTFSETE